MNSEDTDEMPHSVVFHQSLHCLLRQYRYTKKEIQYVLEIITCDPLIYTMDHPEFLYVDFIENSIGLKRVNPFMPSNRMEHLNA